MTYLEKPVRIEIESEQKIEKIFNNFPEIVRRTPLELHEKLSKKFGCKVYLKREDLQIVRSYKIRGAFNSVSKLSQGQKERGVVCASAGNHSQGVALSCNYLGIKGRIFMPKNTPEQKIKKTKEFGGKFIEVFLCGDTFDDACKEALKYCQKNKMKFIHPFDNLDTIDGQATIGFEIWRQFPREKIDCVFVPVGGGGLVSGLGNYLKLKDKDIKIIGVEPVGASSLYYSLKNDQRICLNKIDSFVDGASVKKIGKINFEICKKIVDKVIRVQEDKICSTILEFLNEGIILEPAGALSVSALENMKEEIRGKNIVCILSGGNLDFSRFPEIVERYKSYNTEVG